jgi:chromosome segregation ATPase
MTQAARVTSVEALERLHEALAKFGQEGQEALATAEGEARRGLEAVQDRLAFWQREVNRRQEEVNRARADLAHRRSLHDDRRTGAVEQEIALARAQQRLREAEEKVVVCRRWMIHLPDAVEEFEGPARQLAGLLDADLKVSLAKLQDKIDTLHAYAALGVPSGGLPPAMSSAPPSVAMPAPSQQPDAPEKTSSKPPAAAGEEVPSRAEPGGTP